MAGAPLKTKLDYFSLDVDYYDDPKIVRIRSQYGVTGEIVTIRLLCEIYRNSYYIEWSENLQYALADKMKLKPMLISDVVSSLIRYDFFDELCFKNYSVLTSKGIQKRWKIANARRKKPPDEYWLLPIDDNNNLINVDINANNDSTNTEKGKERKGYIEEEEEARARVSLFDLDDLDTVGFYEYTFSARLTNGQKHELNGLINRFGDDAVSEAIEQVKGRNLKHPLQYLHKYLKNEELRSLPDEA